MKMIEPHAVKWLVKQSCRSNLKQRGNNRVLCARLRESQLNNGPDFTQLPTDLLNIITSFLPDCEITIDGKTEEVNYDDLLGRLKETTSPVEDIKLLRPLPLTREYCNNGVFTLVRKIVGDVICKDPNMSNLFFSCLLLKEINDSQFKRYK